MEVWKSWAVVGVIGVCVYWYYFKQPANSRRPGRATVLNEQGQQAGRRTDGKKNRKKEESASGTDQLTSDAAASSISSAGDESNKNKKGKKQKTNTAPETKSNRLIEESNISTQTGAGDDDGMDNKEFARQLLGAKMGDSLKPTGQEAKPRKTKKLGKSEEITNGVPRISATSSTTGADADDDLSPATSPNMVAQTLSTGVEDMIEAPAPGPSVLKITAPLQPPKNTQPKAPKPAQPQETQKQRQNRRKREAQKFEREQAEKERRVLMEKQLRTAREAEGRPAKNGVPVSKPPAKNAWDAPSTTSNGIGSTPTQTKLTTTEPTALLDTLAEPVVTNTSKMNGTKAKGKAKVEEPVVAATSKTSGSKSNGKAKDDGKAWHQELPTEEEQMRMLSELSGDDGWQQVGKSKKGNKKDQKGFQGDTEKAVEKEAKKEVKGVTVWEEDGNQYEYPEPVEPHYLSAQDLEGDEPDLRTFEEAEADLLPLTEVNPLVKEWDPNGPLDKWGHNKKTGNYEPFSQTGHPDDSDWKVC
ncbi:MAG: hypothetical protein MMC33_009094 [Icmadophila ericetorum]|nr:hypothetical protein [Icmadophila ericetorum]